MTALLLCLFIRPHMFLVEPKEKLSDPIPVLGTWRRKMPELDWDVRAIFFYETYKLLKCGRNVLREVGCTERI